MYQLAVIISQCNLDFETLNLNVEGKYFQWEENNYEIKLMFQICISFFIQQILSSFRGYLVLFIISPAGEKVALTMVLWFRITRVFGLE